MDAGGMKTGPTPTTGLNHGVKERYRQCKENESIVPPRLRHMAVEQGMEDALTPAAGTVPPREYLKGALGR